MKHAEELIYWITEREEIRRNKEAGAPRPWTNDYILAAYRFCNVNRDDDTVTKWIHENWSIPHFEHQGLAFALTMARMVNLPSTLEALGYPMFWDRKHFIDTIRDLKADGAKVWTSAYMITGGYSAGGEDKETITARVLDQVHEKLLSRPVHYKDTLAIVADRIKSPGIGTFLSAQVVADLKRTPQLWSAPDWMTWCGVGPGSTIGLNILNGRPITATIKDKQFIDEVAMVRELIKTETGLNLCAQNTQNCLCEFNKYYRAKYMGYRPKSRYTPRPTPPATTPLPPLEVG